MSLCIRLFWKACARYLINEYSCTLASTHGHRGDNPIAAVQENAMNTRLQRVENVKLKVWLITIYRALFPPAVISISAAGWSWLMAFFLPRAHKDKDSLSLLSGIPCRFSTPVLFLVLAVLPEAYQLRVLYLFNDLSNYSLSIYSFTYFLVYLVMVFFYLSSNDSF